MASPYSPAAREFLREVARAYHNSPEEVALVIALFGALAVGLTVYLAIESRRSARRRREWSQAEFDRIVESRGVAPSGRDALERMARAYGTPQQKHRIVQEAPVFDRAALQAARDGRITSETVSALRVVLGIPRRNGAVPRSTTELAVGSTVAIRRNGNKPVAATVTAQQPEGFTVDAGAAASRFPSGGRVEITLTTTAGVFRTTTFSQGFENGAVHLRHREGMDRNQKRRHYRRTTRFHAKLVLPDGAETWIWLRDLGGGGASFKNPEAGLQPGSSIAVVLPGIGPGGRDLALPAKIIRTSEDGDLCHAEFSGISESDRDRVYRVLFAPR
ncbi:MAG: PilZ domain-containing protein [bacterium]